MTITDVIAGREAAYRTLRRRRAGLRTVAAVAFCGCFVLAARLGEVSPSTLAGGLHEAGDYARRMLPEIRPATFGADVAGWYWGWRTWLGALFDTVLIALVSTTLGVAAAVPLGLLASRKLTGGWLCVVVRRSLELVRTVPILVYALAFVLAFGLGSTAGVLAIALHSSSSLGKLFSEVNETVSDKPIEALRSAGGGWAALVRFGVLPQVTLSYVSYVLLRFEKNVRSATVIGFVGAGGIGQELFVAIRSFQYQDVSAIALMIIGSVVLTDLACERLRRVVA